MVVRAAQQGGGGSGQSVSRAGPLIVDTVIAAPPNAPDPLPVIVGHLASHASRWDQMMSWLPSFIEEIGGVLYRVNCTAETDAIQGVIDCHTLVGAAAIRHYEQRGGGNNATGAYIDLEDNCKPSQRADYSLLPQLVSTLMEHPEWYFLHLSRFPRRLVWSTRTSASRRRSTDTATMSTSADRDVRARAGDVMPHGPREADQRSRLSLRGGVR